jgi:uncharacterized protein YeaO (DUF488 family)
VIIGIWTGTCIRDRTVSIISSLLGGILWTAVIGLSALHKSGEREMIRVASFFKAQDHIGQVFSIARSQPRGRNFEEIPILFPDSLLLKEYKEGLVPWEDYTIRYNTHLATHRREVFQTLHRILSQEEEITLCCWEHDPDHCHRSLVAKFLKDKFGYKVEVF